jgi:hypothetical protein
VIEYHLELETQIKIYEALKDIPLETQTLCIANVVDRFKRERANDRQQGGEQKQIAN